ncbi:hypothetical protein [Streptomyces sparsogenes]|uniref:hypothetical protein n=1 Tax=Streptomyces sparsogenes TaxID=67365 RepID=UPI0020132CCD|nr:hypothetical protein [Streptomyces sparsogenes]
MKLLLDWLEHRRSQWPNTTTRVAADRLAEYGVRVRPRDSGQRVLLDEFYSPRCGTLLDARIRVEAATAG